MDKTIEHKMVVRRECFWIMLKDTLTFKFSLKEVSVNNM